MPTGRAFYARRTLHALLSVLAAATLWALPATAAATLLAGATLIALSVELVRRTTGATARRFERTFGSLLKEGEASRLTGATMLAVGFTITAVATPGAPALAGVLMAGIGDPAAAMVGRRWGRMRFAGRKTVLGSAAFAAIAFGTASVLGLDPFGAFLVASLALAAEAPTLPVDDNLYLPFAGALAFLAGSWLTGM